MKFANVWWVGLLTKINKSLAQRVADGLGIKNPKSGAITNHSFPADADPQEYQSVEANPDIESAPSLSMANTVKDTIKTRQIAILAADGVDDQSLDTMQKALTGEGAVTKIVSVHLGHIQTSKGKQVKVDKSLLTAASVLFDAVYLPSGKESVDALLKQPKALEFVLEAYKHCKAIASDGDGTKLLRKLESLLGRSEKSTPAGVFIDADKKDFIAGIAQHRFWGREKEFKNN